MAAAEHPRLPRDLVFVDLETTGCNAAHHRITEIGIVRIADGAPVEEWSTLVNPECRIPPYIQSFTGISDEMVADAPRFEDVAKEVLERLRPAGSGPEAPAPMFVAHNARFDYAFLRAEFRRIGVNFAARVLCTVKLSRRLFPQHHRHGLDAVMARHGLECSARHRALGDARVLSQFWLKLRGELPEGVLAAGVDAVVGARALPAQLPDGLAEELPEGPGVYLFYGSDDALLYVGKSNTLRTRVLAHFAAEHSGSKELMLARQVRRIDWQETAGELGALLREAELVRAARPVCNRRLKSVSSFTLQVAEDAGAARIVALEALAPAELEACYGVFLSQKDARKALTDIARAQQLCLKAMGLEQSEGSCFAYQLGKCRGACVGQEPPALHGVRLRMALASLKLKPWPFPGRVAIVEGGRPGATDWHVLDHWTYLGTARSDEELEALAAARAPAGFDAHVYRILVRHLAAHPKLKWRSLALEARSD